MNPHKHFQRLQVLATLKRVMIVISKVFIELLPNTTQWNIAQLLAHSREQYDLMPSCFFKYRAEV